VSNQPKQVELKTLLDKIEKNAASSPEIANELLNEFKKNSEHLREMDRKALSAQITITYIGQLFGLIIGMTAIISGAIIASLGSQWAGGFIGGGGVIGLVSVFVLGRRKPV
jgi:uncharacterized membrane protein